ncbi:potassium channel family protein [Enterovirga sp.]|jgi:voltage-gated potassium channel|uniref:potassium channel family protein n=1 Tax=Enterovirga sp. TaxID=2026350 RepID=UPI0026193AB4|nr:potassium channel family protein [Enterovirga sp.]MDB5592238.1 ion transporter [Enterovirga sp.]
MTTTTTVPGSGGAGSIMGLLRELYDGQSDRAYRFRYGLLAFDISTILFVVVSSFIERTAVLTAIDAVVGILVAADFLARFATSRTRWRDFGRLSTWADIVAVVSFLGPIVGEGGGFLRILRTLRLLRSYQVTERLRKDSEFYCYNEEVIQAVVNLFVFIFVMTGIVYVTQHTINPAIRNYVDALYFTVTSLTTTGYGDVTLPGTTGRLLSVAIMIFGVTLFLRLAQVLFRPHKVKFTCPTCALMRHDEDAVHCKACGTTLLIPDEGR